MNYPKERRESTLLGTILLIFLGCALTGITTLVVSRIQTKEPNLVYSINEGLSLNKIGVTRRMYNLRIKNTGQREVPDFKANFLYPGQIEDFNIGKSPGVQLSEPQDTSTSSQDTSWFLVGSNYLNPSDTVSITFLTLSKDPPSDNTKPIVDVRGRGVVGKRIEQGPERMGRRPLIAYYTIGLFSLIYGFLVAVLRKKFASFIMRHLGI